MPTQTPQSIDELEDLPGPGEVVLDKYRIERVIGRGGMGVVVEALHLELDEHVAIKFLKPEASDDEALARFEREARAAVKIRSEHAVRVLDVGKLAGSTPYMVMELCDGSDLAALLAAGPLPVAKAVSYVLQTCEAIAVAHALGIVHRDLKPENLFLTRRADGSDCIKVLDFGLSKLPPRASGESRARVLTEVKAAMGSPRYMAPEQWLSAHEAGPAADQWALGVILFELITGKPPFEGFPLAQLCARVQHAPPPSLGGAAPDGLERIIHRCLEKRPEDRFASVGDLAVALCRHGPLGATASAERIVGVFRQAGITTLPPPARETARARAVSWRGALVAGLVGAAALFVAVAVRDAPLRLSAFVGFLAPPPALPAPAAPPPATVPSAAPNASVVAEAEVRGRAPSHAGTPAATTSAIAPAERGAEGIDWDAR